MFTSSPKNNWNNFAPSSSSSTNNTTPSSSSSTHNSITRSSNTYIYGVGVFVVLIRGAFALLHITRNLFKTQIKNKSRGNLWTPGNNLVCFRSNIMIAEKEGIKRKSTKIISRNHEYHETCWWNMWRDISKRLCCLKKMVQWVNNCFVAWRVKKTLYTSKSYPTPLEFLLR